ALALVGWGVVSFLAVANSFIQLATPDSLRGRVMSVYTLVFLGMAPVGSSIMGAIAHAMGTPAAVAIGALACFAAVLSLAGHLKALGR
ncbi:MAG TPA: MFS transporter, partial [Thermodesulfovibrionales bacterium]|nr:MFS transporter [Thermodesulfovibrionales bacterium]